MKKTFIAVMSVMLSLFFSMQTFAYVDVEDTTRYGWAIDFLTEEGVVKGYSDDSFRPRNLVNRAEFLKMLMEGVYRNSGSMSIIDTYANSKCFSDVPKSEWYTKYVCAAKAMEVVQGYEGNLFKPEQTINIVEALKIVLKVYGYNPDEGGNPWYEETVEIASDLNIIPLFITEFDQELTRGEMADLITRTLKVDEGGIEEYLDDFIDYRVTFESIDDHEDIGEEAEDDLNCTYGAVECSGGGGGGEISDLIDEVCEDADRSGSRYLCEDSDYDCQSVKEVSFGNYDFLQCEIFRADEDDVLRYGGGLGGFGYNLIANDDGDPRVINSVNDLADFWGEINTDDDAIEFIKAATNTEDIYSRSELDDYAGEDFERIIGGTAINYTEVDKSGDIYEVIMYDKEIYGCSPFDVFEVKYELTEEGDLDEEYRKIIGRIDNDLCVD